MRLRTRPVHVAGGKARMASVASEGLQSEIQISAVSTRFYRTSLHVWIVEILNKGKENTEKGKTFLRKEKKKQIFHCITQPDRCPQISITIQRLTKATSLIRLETTSARSEKLRDLKISVNYRHFQSSHFSRHRGQKIRKAA